MQTIHNLNNGLDVNSVHLTLIGKENNVRQQGRDFVSPISIMRNIKCFTFYKEIV